MKYQLKNNILKIGKGVTLMLFFVLAAGCLYAIMVPSAVRGFNIKSSGGSLGAADWNALRGDFLAIDGDTIVNNSMLGDLDMSGSFRVTNISNPTADTDGASQQWILSRIADATSGGSGYKIVCGSTPTGGWVNYPPLGAGGFTGAIALAVDTRSSVLSPNFSTTPLYFTSLGGSSMHYDVNNAVTIDNPTNTGFIAVVASAYNPTLPNSTWGWYINWCGVGN